MVIDYLNASGVTVAELKTNAPLIIDPDAPLAFAFSLQGFQAVSRRNPQLINPDHSIQHGEFSQCNGFDGAELPTALSAEQRFRLCTAKGQDSHEARYYRKTILFSRIMR